MSFDIRKIVLGDVLLTQKEPFRPRASSLDGSHIRTCTCPKSQLAAPLKKSPLEERRKKKIRELRKRVENSDWTKETEGELSVRKVRRFRACGMGSLRSKTVLSV